MKKIFILMVGIMVAVCLSVPGYSQAEEDKTILQSNKGQVVDFDWVAGVLVMKWYDDDINSWDETSFKVNKDTKVLKGAETIDLDDIEEGDEVRIRYLDNGLAGFQAVEIVVQI